MAKYVPCIDNYMLSIPPTAEEEWRVETQLLYDSMRATVADPLTINGQWFDVHEDSDEINPSFRIHLGKFIVGVRKIVHPNSLRKFLRAHQNFFDLAYGLQILSEEERKESARKMVEVYKSTIDCIKEAREARDSTGEILSSLPEDFALRQLLEHHIVRELTNSCFRYPNTAELPTQNYATTLGSHYLLKDRVESAKEFTFIPADQPYIESMHPGFLDSYHGRLKFARETLEGLDLTRERTKTMLGILLS